MHGGTSVDVNNYTSHCNVIMYGDWQSPYIITYRLLHKAEQHTMSAEHIGSQCDTTRQNAHDLNTFIKNYC